MTAKRADANMLLVPNPDPCGNKDQPCSSNPPPKVYIGNHYVIDYNENDHESYIKIYLEQLLGEVITSGSDWPSEHNTSCNSSNRLPRAPIGFYNYYLFIFYSFVIF